MTSVYLEKHVCDMFFVDLSLVFLTIKCAKTICLAVNFVQKYTSIILFLAEQKNSTESRSETQLFLHTLMFEN